MNKWEVMGHNFEDIGMLLLTECENMATNCSFDPGFKQMYEHYEIMLRTLTTQHRLIQDAFNMLDARFSEKQRDDEGGNGIEQCEMTDGICPEGYEFCSASCDYYPPKEQGL